MSMVMNMSRQILHGDGMIKPSTQEEVDMYMDLIDNTKKVGGWNQAILDIIIEESKAYFSGDKNVDETADIIQNRVKTYVNENR